jgi:hypothetical protein
MNSTKEGFYTSANEEGPVRRFLQHFKVQIKSIYLTDDRGGDQKEAAAGAGNDGDQKGKGKNKIFVLAFLSRKYYHSLLL